MIETTDMLKPMIHGALVMACLACALFFLRFWRASRDRLFAFFALAFSTMALNWMALTLLQVDDERRHYVYLLRLFSFLIILYAIWDKNRAGRGSSPS
jgi:peptidoglycan/LPS O-acetylase OafA/YrhL